MIVIVSQCSREMIQKRWLVHPDWGITSWERISTSSKASQTNNWEIRHVTLYKKEERVLRRRNVLAEREMRLLLRGDIRGRPRISWLISAEVNQTMMMHQINHMSPYPLDLDNKL